MFQNPEQDAEASTAAPTTPSTPKYEVVRHLLFGSWNAAQATIKLLHKLNYAEPNDWSQAMAPGRPNEMIAILTKRVIAPKQQL